MQNQDDRGSLCWVIHKPTRGWYIRLRSPAFPPGSFISLSPPTADIRQTSAGCLEFGCRTNPYPAPGNLLTVNDSEFITLTKAHKPEGRHSGSRRTSTSSDHSYPPSANNSPSSSSVTLTVPPQSQITKFVLKPLVQEAGTSFLWKALSRFRKSSSFALLPADEAKLVEADPEDAISHHLVSFQEIANASFANSTGVITINETLALQMGVDKSFWVAIALAYWEFLNEREVSFQSWSISVKLMRIRVT